MRVVMMVIGLGAMLTAVPAAADSLASSTKSKSTAAGAGKEPKYCLQYEASTGSRITATTCKSKADWAREGIRVDELVK